MSVRKLRDSQRKNKQLTAVSRNRARRNEDRRIPLAFDGKNLLAARGRAQRMIHRGALSLFGKHFQGVKAAWLAGAPARARARAHAV